MVNFLKMAWSEVVQPMVQRPRHVQVGAICLTGEGEDRRVLMITSRETKRWIVPKGWPIDGLDESASAEQEAWEEAGVKAANVRGAPIGAFHYDKLLDSGQPLPCEVQVFRVDVDHLDKIYPEAGERSRKWVTPAEAANMVQEPGLKEILLNL